MSVYKSLLEEVIEEKRKKTQDIPIHKLIEIGKGLKERVIEIRKQVEKLDKEFLHYMLDETDEAVKLIIQICRDYVGKETGECNDKLQILDLMIEEQLIWQIKGAASDAKPVLKAFIKSQREAKSLLSQTDMKIPVSNTVRRDLRDALGSTDRNIEIAQKRVEKIGQILL